MRIPGLIFLLHKITKCNKDKVVYYVTTTYKLMRGNSMNKKKKYSIYVMIFTCLCSLVSSFLILSTKESIYYYNLILPIISVLAISFGCIWLIKQRKLK